MSSISQRRLHHQQLTQSVFKTPCAVVAWMGAMQSQEYLSAKWALGLRLNGFNDADIEHAFNKGDILRTHVMRPTWHFVTPADIRWMLALTAPRVHQVSAYMYRQVNLEAADFAKAADVLVKALEGGKQLTRTELGDILARAGMQSSALRLGMVMMWAELEAIICSGGRAGKQFTYALLDERAPQAKVLPREEALAALVKTFFTSHAPATVHDFARWSGLTVADTKHGIELVKEHLLEEDIDGITYWAGVETPQGKTDREVTRAFLLPAYDEYTIAYKEFSGVLDPAFLQQVKEKPFGGTIVIDGQVLGYWHQTRNKKTVEVKLTPFRPLSGDELELLNEQAASRYAAFLGQPVKLVL